MTTSITPDYFFVTALPTPLWGRVVRYCQSQPNGEDLLLMYRLAAPAGLTIDVSPLNADDAKRQLPCGTFFSERYHRHTFADVVQAVREGALDAKVLTYPELLSGHDTMVVFFWPDYGDVSRGDSGNVADWRRKADELFDGLVTRAVA